SEARLHQSVQAAGAGRERAPPRAAGRRCRGHAGDAVRRWTGAPSRPSDQAARDRRRLGTEVRGERRGRVGEREAENRAGGRNDRVTAPIPNLFKVPELKEKLLFTLLCLVIYRIGAHIATPGVNVDALADFMSTRGTGTLFGLYDLFSGGGLRRATVFALGIMPYISASIVFQLAGPVFPIIERILPETVNTFEALKTGTLSFAVLLIVLFIMVLVVAGTVAITVAARRIPVHIPRKVMGRGRIREGQKTFIPLRINSAGVMPIIFAQSL